MRSTVLAALLILPITMARAQPTPPPPEDLPPPAAAAPQAQPAPPPRPGGRARFEAANVTHDGKLTREQAEQAHWMGLVRHFDEVDRDHKGYVTLQDLHDFAAARRAAKQGAAH
jgi:hypothetical protein